MRPISTGGAIGVLGAHRGTGREPFSGSVRVEANRIAAVTKGKTTPAGEGATVVDGAGATLMPGLIESHAHIGLADLGSYDLTRVPPEEHMLITVRNARTMLDEAARDRVFVGPALGLTYNLSQGAGE